MLVAVVAIVAALGSKSLVSSSLTVRSPSSAASPVDRSRNEQRDALGEAGGAVPDGTTVFDDEVPGVVNLDPALTNQYLEPAPRQIAPGSRERSIHPLDGSGWIDDKSPFGFSGHARLSQALEATLD